MVLAPPEESNLAGAGGFFPPGYCSVASFFWSYLLAYGNSTCISTAALNDAWPGVSAAQLATLFSVGIYSHSLYDP